MTWWDEIAGGGIDEEIEGLAQTVVADDKVSW
jgi:hypothetical protein